MKLKSFVTITTTLMMFTAATQARVVGRGTSVTGETGDISSDETEVRNAPSVRVSSGVGETCDPKKTKGFVSQNFVKTIVDPSVAQGKELKVVKRGDGTYQVEMNKYLKACTDIQFDVVKTESNYFVRMQNIYEYKPENVDLTDGANFDDLTDDEKYYRCLQKKTLLKKDGSIDRKKAAQMGLVESSRASRPFTVAKSDKKSAYLFFASAKGTEYGPIYPTSKATPNPGWSCVTYENFMKEDVNRLYTSKRDEVYDRAYEVCETESAEKILNELARLRENSVGNFRELEKILEDAFLKAQAKETEAIYDRLSEIEKAFKPDEDGIVSEETAESLAKEYKDLLRTLHKIVVAPNAKEIKRLLEKRTNNNRTQIDAKIKDLNMQIRKYADRKSPNYEHMRGALVEYGKSDDILTIFDFWLASDSYGRVYKGKRDVKRGKPFASLEDANKHMEKTRKKFIAERLDRWEGMYAASQGGKGPLLQTQSEIKSVKRRMDANYRNYMLKMQNDQPQSCKSWIKTQHSMQQCAQWKKKMESMYLNSRKRDLVKLRNLAGDFATYDSLYKKHQETRQEEVESGVRTDPFGFVTSYDGDYSLVDYDSVGSDSSSYDTYSLINFTGSGRTPANNGMVWGPGQQNTGFPQQNMPVQPMPYWNQGNPYGGYMQQPQGIMGPGMGAPSNYGYQMPFMPQGNQMMYR